MLSFQLCVFCESVGHIEAEEEKNCHNYKGVYLRLGNREILNGHRDSEEYPCTRDLDVCGWLLRQHLKDDAEQNGQDHHGDQYTVYDLEP